jgi:N-acetylmuramoyl-L-alanine amidase
MPLTIRSLKGWLSFRERKQPTTTIVLHATAGGTIGGALAALRLRKLSYHYLIDQDGTVTKCCPLTKVAFHAGISVGPNGPNVNNYSIGISLVNHNDGKDIYEPEQVRALRELCLELRSYIPSIKWLTTHWAISPGRKTDPRAFPAKSFASDVRLQFWPGG